MTVLTLIELLSKEAMDKEVGLALGGRVYNIHGLIALEDFSDTIVVEAGILFGE